MKTNTVLIGASLIAVAGLAIARWSAHSKHEAELTLTTRTKERVSLSAELERFQTKIVATEKEAAEFQRALDDAEKKKVVAIASEAAKTTRPPRTRPTSIEITMKDPTLQNLYFAGQRMVISTTYAPLLRKLALPPAQTAAFETAMIKRAEQELDLQAVAQAQGLKANDPAVAKLRSDADAALQASLSELLGADGYRQWQEHERTVGVMSTQGSQGGVQGIVQRFAGTAISESVPISTQQAEQMVQILAESSARYARGEAADFKDIDWIAADRKLQSVLTEAQLQLFQRSNPGGASRHSGLMKRALDEAVKVEKASKVSAGSTPRT